MDETLLEEGYEAEETSEDVDTSEQDSETYEESNEDSEKPAKKPNSFKRLREENRALKKALKEKESTTVTLKPDQELDARFFFIENPDAKEFKEDIKKTIIRFPNMSFDEAYTYLKATMPKPSVSKQDFNFKSKQKPADMMNMDDDEAAEKLSPSEYLKYTRAKGSNFLKPSLGRK